MRVTILGKPDCHLCHVALRIARELQADYPFALEYTDITQSASLQARYADRIPVLLIDDQEAGWGKLTAKTMRRAMRKARWSRPISRILSRLRGLLKRG